MLKSSGNNNLLTLSCKTKKTVFSSFSYVDIIFRENQFVPLERTRLYGITEFMASCGGILGLFLGFSFMSVLEIIYFCTIRLVCNIRMIVLKRDI
jgi:Amiloride-sensitive sodium channel